MKPQRVGSGVWPGGEKELWVDSKRIRIGIGGWTYAPWRGPFYPKGVTQAKELEYAAARLGAIEINGTYYRLQSPKSWEAWGRSAPDGFQFSVKASRYCTNRKDLREAGESIDTFLGQGLTLLGDKLGPILWQFMPTKRFDADEFGAFLDMLPRRRDGIALRHAVEPRHESFRDPAFIAMARKAGVSIVFAQSADYPEIADLTADFAYARLQCSREEIETGYTPAEIDRWATVAREWAKGEAPKGLDYAGAPGDGAGPVRDVYLFFISGAKVRNPAAAEALIGALGA